MLSKRNLKIDQKQPLDFIGVKYEKFIKPIVYDKISKEDCGEYDDFKYEKFMNLPNHSNVEVKYKTDSATKTQANHHSKS